MVNAIETVNLGKTYKGGVEALKSLNLKVPLGESIGYLGPNGAGKTTTIQILLNLIRPTEGETYLFGEQMVGQENKILRNVGSLVEIPGFYDYLTPNDLYKHICKLYRIPKNEMQPAIDITLDLLNVLEVKDKKIGTFSTGMKRRIAIGQALVHDPELIILDEPTIGLDPKGVREIRDLIKGLNKDGKTVFLTSHNLTEVSEISERVVFIKKGESIQDIKMVDLSTNLKVKQIEIKFSQDLDPSQKTNLEGIDGIDSVSYGKTSQINYFGDTSVVEDILSQIVSQKLPVFSFTPRSMTLEDLYLDLFGKEVST